MMKPDSIQEAPAPASTTASSGYRLPRFPWGDGGAKSNSSEEQSKFRLSRVTWGVLAFVLVVIIITLPVYFATRPETVQVIESTAEETLPSLIKVAPIGTATAAILIEYTELLEDNSTVFYYLSAQDLNSTTLEGVTDPNDVALYLTRSSNPTIEDLFERRALLVGNDTETSLRIGFLSNITFPFRLPEFFFPGDFNGAILVEESMQQAVSVATFSVVVDPEQNIGSGGTIATIAPTLPPTTQFPTPAPTRMTTASPSYAPSKSPTASPTNTPTTKSPTQSPTLFPTTAAPTAKPTRPPSPGPTVEPTVSPTSTPTGSPTKSPTAKPSPQPSPEPTSKPTISPQPSLRGSTPPPTKTPTLSPTNMPTSSPSRNPTSLPTKAPSKSPTATPTPIPTNKPSTAPSGKPTNFPTINPTGMPTSRPSLRPTQEPTNNPTKFPTAEPTVSPTKAPVSSSSLQILTAELNGSYSIDGTITIDYVQGFENGQVVNRPRLQFDIPNLSNAPGPYLYLSKRSYSETRSGDLEDEDIFIPIDSGENGQFNVKGRFDQFLDEIENDRDLEDYANGSWIVWCRPFGVWIGGGEISAS